MDEPVPLFKAKKFRDMTVYVGSILLMLVMLLVM